MNVTDCFNPWVQKRKKKWGIPWVLETNELYYQEAVKDREALQLSKKAEQQEKRAYEQCDLLVVISESLKELIVRSCHIEENKVVVVPNGLSKQYLIEKKIEKENQSMKIGFVGYLSEWMGLQFLLEAMAQVELPIQLEIMGDGPYKKSLIDLSEKLGLQKKVKFHGFVQRPRLFEILDSTHLGFSGQSPLSTQRFHSPMKLYEYLGRGLPVIASDDADSKELLENHQIGFMFRHGNVESLVQCLQEAFEGRQRWSEMGWRGRERIASQYLWKQRVKILLDGMVEKGLINAI